VVLNPFIFFFSPPRLCVCVWAHMPSATYILHPPTDPCAQSILSQHLGRCPAHSGPSLTSSHLLEHARRWACVHHTPRWKWVFGWVFRVSWSAHPGSRDLGWFQRPGGPPSNIKWGLVVGGYRYRGSSWGGIFDYFGYFVSDGTPPSASDCSYGFTVRLWVLGESWLPCSIVGGRVWGSVCRGQ